MSCSYGIRVAVIFLLACASVATAQTPAGTAGEKAAATANQTQAIIAGTAIDSRDAPIANARVRLRNLDRRVVEQSSSTDNFGEFRFVVSPESTYVVELVERTGRVLAVSPAISARTGEVAGVMLAMPDKLPPTGSIVGDTLGAILSAILGTGVTALEAPPPVSPEQ